MASLSLSDSERDALTLWESFPVDEIPRPTVLLSDRWRVGPRGFLDGDSKMAFLNGNIRAEVEVPHGVLTALTERPNPGVSGAPVVITQADQVLAEFVTDRGPRPLPAYELRITGMNEPCHVLDPTVPVWWSAVDQNPPLGRWERARITPDDRSVTLSVFGGALTEFLAATFVEYETVVLARPQTRQRQVPLGTAVPAVGVVGRVTGSLSAALGARVLIDHRGVPYVVTSD